MSNSDDLAKAFKFIVEEKQEKTGTLNLGGLHLTEIPNALKELKWLTALELWDLPVVDLSLLAELSQLQSRNDVPC